MQNSNIKMNFPGMLFDYCTFDIIQKVVFCLALDTEICKFFFHDLMQNHLL